jgi:hypothetical protein
MKKAGVDQKILAILRFNNIEVSTVEKFIGNNENYYNVLINGEIKKLKIPGIDYIQEEETEVFTSFEFEEEKELIEAEKESKKFEEKVIFEQKTFEEELIESEKESEKLEQTISFSVNNLENSSSVIPEINISNEEKVKEDVIKPKRKPKSKKIDEDIDDFINII